MIQALEWLLNLQHIDLTRDAPLSLQWNLQVQAWVLFGLGLVAGVWILVHHRHEPISSGRKTVLAFIRGGLVALVLIALCEPALVLQRERIEPSYVALLFDTSASMAQTDRFVDAEWALSLTQADSVSQPQDTGIVTRLDVGKHILERNRGALLARMLAANGLGFSVFSSGVTPLGTTWDREHLDSLLDTLSTWSADGTETDLAQAISETLKEAGGRRLAAIVLVSDGRHTQSSSLAEALQRAADRQIPIYPLRIGAPDPRFDVEVGPLRAQETVFANDILAIETQVTLRGAGAAMPLTLQLIDEQTSRVLATADVVPTPGVQPTTAELRTKPPRTGRISFRAEIAPLAQELFADNNADRVVVNVLDERVRVLYVEGAPRYEYRYLKNALVREPTVELSVLLLDADERFVQEGTDPIRRFPADLEELDRYDVLLMGDVDPRGGWLSTAQMEMIVEFVGRRGGGFGLIAGERYAPRFFDETPIEKLIPVRIDTTFLGRYDSNLAEGYHARLTEAGRLCRLFRFSQEQQESIHLFNQLPPLFWIARTLGPKPGAAVLADHPDLQSTFGAMPLVVTGHYGAGKLLFQATDDTWRWRRHAGEALHDAYWVQIVRELTAPGRIAQERRYAIRADRKSYPTGAPVRLQVEVFDPELLARQRELWEVSVSAWDADESEGGPGTTRPPASTDRVGSINLRRISDQSPLYEASFVPPRPGRFVAEVTDIPAKPGEEKPYALIRVTPPDLEFRRPEADHENLERIASATGGVVVEPDQVEEVLLSIRDRSARIPDDVVEPLWDSRLILAVFVLMISIEWLLRKTFGLV